MMPRIQLLVLAVLLLSSPLSARTPHALHYTVDLQHPAEHHITVTLNPIGYRGKVMTFQMPAWAPGAYSLTHYGRYVQDLRAADKRGKSLHVTRIDDDRWQIEPAQSVASLTYEVLDSHDDSTSLYFAMANFDTSIVYANATALFGYINDDKSAPSEVTYVRPAGWQIVTSLPSSNKGFAQDTSTSFTATTFYASNYDMLADAPVMAAPAFQARSFREGSAVYDIALVSQSPFAMDSLEEYTRRIVRAETGFFGETPFARYFFIVYAPTMEHLPGFAQGALEHANSSNYLLVNVPWGLFRPAFLNVFSHEFFHLWDVKRIHSAKLGPFDYAHRVETTSLWLAEGVTDYYAHSLLARSGIATADDFFRDIQTWARALQHMPAHTMAMSLEQLSMDESNFEMDNAAQFYIKGPLVAWMLDVEIRRKTDNARSLDDVMLALNRDAHAGKTFADESLIGLIEKYSGIDLKDFYERYIHGTDTLPIEQYLSYVGLRSAAKQPSGSLTMSSDSALVFESIDEGSSYALAGIKAGDRLVAVDGTPLTLDNIELLTNARNERRSVAITVERNGARSEHPIDFNASGQAARVGPYEIDPHATALAAHIRGSLVAPKS